MGVPKQKWTSEEEASLKAGIAKHGPGKWSTILKDSEFGSVLRLRSNVDLKDKWRNLQWLASGCGSRQRARPTKSKIQRIHTPENISIASNEERDMQIFLPDPPSALARTLQNGSSKVPMPRLDSLIPETIANQESRGSNRSAIAADILEKHSAPPNLEKLLKEELNTSTDGGNLVKVKNRYSIAPTSSSDSKKYPSTLLVELKQECCPTSMTIKILTKAEIDAELEKMRHMTPEQAAAMAMKAVAEAEAAISEAEKAEREAETAEADAKLAKVFAAAMRMRALKQTALCTW